jgi:hypothetical protein
MLEVLLRQHVHFEVSKNICIKIISYIIKAEIRLVTWSASFDFKVGVERVENS